MLNRTYNNGPPPRIGDLVISITDVSIHNMRTDESMDNMTVGVVRKTSTAGADAGAASRGVGGGWKREEVEGQGENRDERRTLGAGVFSKRAGGGSVTDAIVFERYSADQLPARGVFGRSAATRRRGAAPSSSERGGIEKLARGEACGHAAASQGTRVVQQHFEQRQR